jgi:hypothetical protein
MDFIAMRLKADKHIKKVEQIANQFYADRTITESSALFNQHG